MRNLALLSIFVFPSAAQTSPPAVSGEIQALLDAHNYPKAELAIQQKLSTSPPWERGYVLLAQIYNATARYALAEHSGLAAVRLRESVDAFLVLAVATMNLRKLNESIDWLEKAAKWQPRNPEIYRLLGLDYALGGMLRESEEAFRQGLELAPDNWELHYFDGRALYELENFSGSEKAFQRAIERNPRSVKAWTALGQVKDRLGDAASSEQCYQKAVNLCGAASSDCAWPLLELGVVASRQAGEQDAERYFRRAVEARPDWAKPHFYLGKTLATMGQLDAARAQLEDAVRIEPDQSQHHYQLSQIYCRLGDPKKSERHLARYRALAGLEASGKTSSVLNVP